MADKTFQIQFNVDANIGPIKSKVSDLRNAFNNVKLPDNIRKSLEATFQNLSKEITNFESLANKGFSNMADVNKANRSFDKIVNSFSKLQTQIKNLKGVDANKLLPIDTLKRVQTLQKDWEKLRAETGKGLDTSNIIADLDKISDKLTDIKAKRKELIEANKSMGSQKGGYTTQLTKLETERTTKLARATELEGIRGGKSSQEYLKLSSDLKTLNKQINEINEQYSKFTLTIDKNKAKIAEYDVQIGKLEKQEKELTEQLQNLSNAAKTSPEGLKKFIDELKQLDGIDLNEIEEAGEDLEKLQQILANYSAGKLKEATDNINGLSTAVEQTEAPIENAKQELDSYSDSVKEASERSKEFEHVANQIKQFFSIGNTVQLFKRAIRSAFDTIKELDEVMTQTAVVTDFSVGDMWSQLPEYTKRANELGVSVKGAYEAATLYYQQGLETNEVIGVSNETLKMAKIASIDYATATDYMTSALRGFNMEVNEESARKINDIYSELAARTAADTEEISIAMSKTAPLAHNAGMEIETTAALLSQMIETTREAPETLGTAMKTVIARFQELKKDPSLIEPVEGEIIDANKIETALRTIGVALRDTNGQFRDLDDVFLEISQKWNSLDTNTQRYIATIAAGSRQQSRFIAMMANYERTAELVAMANNSAGASQQQFEKTLESMQSKLDRLKNAWNEYTMGLANNVIIKGVIDLLTKFLNMINKLSSAASGKKGVFKSLIDIGLLMGGLKLAKAAFNGFFGWLTKGASLAGKVAGNNLGKGFFGSLDKNIAKVKNLFSKTTWITPKDFKKSLKILDETKQKYQSLAKTLNESNFAEVARSQQAYQASLSNLGKSLRLTNSEMEVSNLLQSAGAEAGLANAAAAGGLNKEKAKEAIANAKAAASTEADVAAKLNDVIATDALNASEELENATKRTGILTQAKAIAQMLFSTGEKQAEAFVTFELAHANIAASASYQALKAAMMSLPFGWILAGIAAVVAAIKIVQALSLDARIERAIESIERSKKAADAAKQTYNDLLSSRSEYNDLQQTLDGLTYGTQAWKEALIEANQQVLELLQNFPQLAQYLERSSQGRLSISDEGWDKFIANQLKTANLLSGAISLGQLQKGFLDERKVQKELDKELYSIFSGKGYSEQLTALLNQGISSNFKEALEENFNIPIYATEGDLEKAAQAILKYDTAVQANQLQMENSTEAFFSTVLDQDIGNQLGDAADGIINIFAQQMIESADDVRKENTKEWLLEIAKTGVIPMLSSSKAELEKQYAELTGQTLKEVKEYDYNKKQLIEEINKVEKSDELISAFEEYAEWVANSTEEGVKTVTEILGDNFENFDSGELADLLKMDLSSPEQLQKMLDLDSKTLEKTIMGLGYTVKNADGTLSADFEAFSEDFGDSIQLIIDQINQSRVDLIQSMMTTGVFGNQGPFRNSKNIEYYLSTLNDQQVVALSQMMDSISSLTKESQIDVFNLVNKSPKQFDEAVSFINSIDFSDPISALSQLQEEAATTGSAFKDMAQNIIDLNPQLFSTSNLFQNFLKSADFDSLDEDLKEFIKDNGKISAKNIKDLAQSSDKLNDLLETGKVNATGLARAFTAFETAGISMDYFTDRVLEALSATESLEEKSLELQDVYSNFDPGLDESFGLDFLSDAAEKMAEITSKYQYGNTTLEGYLREVFPQEVVDAAYDQGTAGIDALINRLNSYVAGDAYGFWSQFAAKGVDGLEGIGKVISQNGEIVFEDLTLTTDELVKKVAEVMQVTEDTALAMIEMYSAHSLEFKKQLETNDYEASLNTLISGSTYGYDYEINEKGDKTAQRHEKILSYQEIEAYAKSLNKEVDEVIADINKNSKRKVRIIDWFDDSGLAKLGEDLWEQIDVSLDDLGGTEGLIKNLYDQGAIQVFDGQARGDLEKIHEILKEIGLTEEQIASITPQLIDENNINSALKGVEEIQVAITEGLYEADIEVPVQLADGTWSTTTETIMADSEEALQAGIEQAQAEAQYGTIATSIAESVKQGATVAAQNIGRAINNVQIRPKKVTVDVYYKEHNKPNTLDADISEGKVRIIKKIVDSYNVFGAKAKGTTGLPHRETALTGEEGYELAYDSHGAFILGANGPELADLEKGTVIYPHDESEKILKGSKKKKFHNYANTPNRVSAGWGADQVAAGGGTTIQAKGDVQVTSPQTEVKTDKTTTDTKDKEESETWENPYDKLYNLLHQINAETRYRQTLERRYQQTLEDLTKSGRELKDVQDQEIASLNRRKQYEEKRITERQKEITDYQNINSDLLEYAYYDANLEEVWIDWEKIDSLNGTTDEEKIKLAERIEDYISKLEEKADDIHEAEDDLIDITEDLKAIEERGKDAYKELEDRVLDALIKQQQEMIDNQEKINKAIDEANTDLVDAMKNSIDKMRQDRENEEKETSLAEKERRLAYLRQDTTGSNALEIKKLEKELEKESQDYSDTLIDQSLNELKDQNDTAAKQREKQIELMQSQLDYQTKIGYFAEKASEVVRNGTLYGDIDPGSELYQLLYEFEDVKKLSNASQEEWFARLSTTIKEAWLYEDKTFEGNGASGSINWTDEMKRALKNRNFAAFQAAEQSRNQKVERNQLTNQDFTESYNKGKREEVDETKDYNAEIHKAMSAGNWQLAAELQGTRDKKIDQNPSLEQYRKNITLDDIKAEYNKANNYKTTSMAESYQRGLENLPADYMSIDYTKKINEILSQAGKRKINWSYLFELAGQRDAKIYNTPGSEQAGEYTLEQIFNEWMRITGGKQFSSGGFADYTGPAWLDGTKTKPEAVLNAKDTENFIQLRNVLSELRNTMPNNNTLGDWYFDIDINVDEIANDYDVDSMVQKVKQSIYDASTYRNVNVINFLK